MAYLQYNPNATLFHYTTVEGLRGILLSKRLWFSNLRKLNDPREIIFASSRIFKIIARISKEKEFRHIGDITHRMGESGRKYTEDQFFYSCSFVQNPESVSMWRHYGTEGAGVCVGFRPTAIKSMPIRIQKVEYLPSESDEILSEMIRRIFRDHVRPNSGLLGDIGFVAELLSLCTSVKHSSWADEREVRGIHAASELAGKVSINGVRIPGYEFPDGRPFFAERLKRISGSSEIDYMSLPFGKYVNGNFDHRKSISKIIIGSRSSLGRDAIEELLRSEGFTGVDIGESEVIWR